MNWNTIDLPVKNIYGKLNIDFTPIFRDNVKLFKEMGYKRILDIGSGERVIIVMGAIYVIKSRVSETLTKYNSFIA